MKKSKDGFNRRGVRRVRDVPGMQTIMCHLYPNRTDCEVCLQDTLDITELLKYIERKNAEHPEYKTTVFHCFIATLARMIVERPVLNRFVQGRRIYERQKISFSFVAKRRFADGAEEALILLLPNGDDTLDSISRKICGDVRETRKSEHSTGGIDATLDAFGKLPRLLLMAVVRIARWMDFWGIVPKALKRGDPNYSTVLISNLGSIGIPAVYHHLNNYGTNSIMMTVGTIHKEERLMPDGHKELRDVVDFSAILDERIGDGFYFGRSLKLLRYIFANPEILDLPLSQHSGYDYK